MASPKLVRLLAVAGMAALLPLANSSSAFAATDDGNWVLVNDTTQQCADLGGTGAQPSGTAVWQDVCAPGSGDNQEWGKLNTRVVDGNQLFVLVNVKSQLCLDLPGYGSAPSGSATSLYACNSNSVNDNQEWYLNPIPGLAGDQYEIVNYKDGLCLDVEGWASLHTDANNRALLDVYACSGSSGDWVGGGAPFPGYDDHVWTLAEES